jgi:adenosylmethionine---8-amino-7-oxononanoate aminotransferase
MMVGIELVQDKAADKPFATSQMIGRTVCEHATENGVWIRPLGDVIILMPPLSISSDEIKLLTSTTINAIEAICQHPESVF